MLFIKQSIIVLLVLLFATIFGVLGMDNINIHPFYAYLSISGFVALVMLLITFLEI